MFNELIKIYEEELFKVVIPEDALKKKEEYIKIEICEGIFKAASVEELALRKNNYAKKVIDEILKENGKQNADGSWDIDDIVDISGLGMTKIPIRFNRISGNFYCNNNKLTSLEGAPKEVGGNFNCNSNKLTSLKGTPVIVSGFFNCSHNQLTTLEGAPKEVSGSFYCWDNIVKFTEDEIRKVCKVRGNIHV